MKKLLFIAIAVIGLSANAQLNVIETEPREEIGKVKVLFDTYMESYKKGDVYTIRYRDSKYTKIAEFKSFTMNEQSFNELYDLIMDNWENPPKEEIMIELEEDIIWLDFTRALGITNLQIQHDPTKTGEVIGLSTQLNKKKVEGV